MAITFNSPPSFIVFARDPYFARFHADNIVDNVGTLAQLTLLFTGAIAENETITLTWATNQITFTAKNSPDNSGLQFPTGDGGRTHIESIITYLEKNYLFQKDFNFSFRFSFFNFLDIIAKTPGPEFNIDCTENLSGADKGATVAGVSSVYKPNYKLFLEIFVKNESDSDFKYTLAQKIDFDSSFNFSTNISPILLAYLYPDVPNYSLNIIKKNLKSIGAFYLRYAESYGNPSQVKGLIKSPTFQTMLSGRSFKNRGLQDYYPLGGLSEYSFLSHAPKERFITLDQRDFLDYYLLPEIWPDVTQIKVNVVINFSDNTQEQKTILTKSGAVLGEKYTIPVNFSKLGILESNSKKVINFNLTLVDQNDYIISDTITYTIFRGENPDRKYFLFLNSLGGWEVLRTEGVLEETAEMNYEESQIFLQDVYSDSQGDSNVYEATLTEKFSATTGFLPKKEYAIFFKEFLLSKHKFLMNEFGLTSIKTTSKSIKLFKDRENLIAIKFDYQNNFKQEYYGN